MNTKSPEITSFDDVFQAELEYYMNKLGLEEEFKPRTILNLACGQDPAIDGLVNFLTRQNQTSQVDKIVYQGYDLDKSSFWPRTLAKYADSNLISIDYKERDCTDPRYFREEDTDLLLFQHPANLYGPIIFERIFANGFKRLKTGGLVVANFHNKEERSAFVKSIEGCDDIEMLVNEPAPEQIYGQLPHAGFTLFSQTVIIRKIGSSG
ncbi:MAG: hypothetical protein OXU45_04670 [Candidatus Melainabacteria bacterium]|nr:hypothetical protein [Candidatus Melainabacteria bacterium]